MATDQEIYRYIMQVEGQEKIAQLSAAASLAQQKFQALYETLGAGHAQTIAAANAFLALDNQLKKTSRNLGTIATQISYAADDLQYLGTQGLLPIMNNVSGLAQAFAGNSAEAAAWAGGISIAAIAAYQLYENSDKLWDLMGSGFPTPALKGLEALEETLKEATKEMETLQKQTRLEWYELKKLAELKVQIAQVKDAIAADKNVAKAAETLSDAERRRGEGFGKAMAEIGGKDVLGQYRDTLEGQKDAKGLVYNEVQARMTTVDDAVRDTFDAALKGDKVARKAITDALGQNSEFSKRVRMFSPERQKELEDQARRADAFDPRIDAAERAEKERQDREDAKDQIRRDAGQRAVDAARRNMAFRREQAQRAGEIVGGAMMERAQGRLEDARAARDAGLERRNSQVIGAEGFANSIQGAVGGRDKQLDEMIKRQDRQTDIFTRMLIALQRNNGAAMPVFGANGNLQVGGN